MPDTAQNALPSPAKRPWLTAAGLWLALAAVVDAGAVALAARDRPTARGASSRLISLAAADAVERGLRGAEEGLHALRAELEEAHLVARRCGEAARMLKTRVDMMPLVQSAVGAGSRSGRVLASIGATEPPPATAAFDAARWLRSRTTGSR